MARRLAFAGSLGLATGSPAAAQAPAAAARWAKQREITRDFQSWYTYAYYQTPLGRAFTALDSSGQELPRQTFLRQLASGQWLALRVGEPGAAPLPAYRLFAYAGGGSIAQTSRQLANTELENTARENRALPPFDLLDLDGHRYTPAAAQGNVLVFKAWFVGCTACVAEFPQVNALVEKYRRSHPDVRFISLALDKAERLRPFLAQRPLRYAVVPESGAYLKELGVAAYPTHIVVGRDGRILKYCTTADDLAAALALAVAKPRP